APAATAHRARDRRAGRRPGVTREFLDEAREYYVTIRSRQVHRREPCSERMVQTTREAHRLVWSSPWLLPVVTRRVDRKLPDQYGYATGRPGARGPSRPCRVSLGPAGASPGSLACRGLPGGRALGAYRLLRRRRALRGRAGTGDGVSMPRERSM